MGKFGNPWRFLLVVTLLIGIAWAATAVTEVTRISGKENWGRYIIEDIVMCEDGKTAWMVGVGPGAWDYGFLYKLDLTTNTVVKDKTIELGLSYGPRGTPGLAIDTTCKKAYVPNYPLNTISVIDLESGTSIDEIPVIASPTDATLTPLDNKYLVVTNTLGDAATVIDTATNIVICKVETGEAVAGPKGPNQVDVIGHAAAYIANRYTDTVAVLDLTKLPKCELHPGSPIEGLGRVPEAIVTTPDGSKAYVANFVADSVSVIDVPAKKVIPPPIPVGDGPKYIAISPDGKFVYVSNTIDKTVSVISTKTDTVVKTIEVVPCDEPAPIGVLAVTKDNSKLYVFWAGGIVGTPSDFQIIVYDLSELYCELGN